MAELNTAPKGDGGGKKVRSKKQNPAVDLTAMVDLAFLLITFFMLTTTLSKPQSMNLSMPDKTPPKEETPPAETPAWRTLTVVLGSDDKLAYYVGSLDNPQAAGEPKITTYGKNGIRQVILNMSKTVKARVSDYEKESLVIIIKPSEKSNYKNFVDILDEMAITQEKRYAVVDITDKDINMLVEKQAYN